MIRWLAIGLVLGTCLVGHVRGDMAEAPGNQADIGGVKVVTANGWFAARPSGTENSYKIYLESFVDLPHLDLLEQDAKNFVAAVFGSAG